MESSVTEDKSRHFRVVFGQVGLHKQRGGQ